MLRVWALVFGALGVFVGTMRAGVHALLLIRRFPFGSSRMWSIFYSLSFFAASKVVRGVHWEKGREEMA